MLIVFNPPGILFILFLILFKPTEDLVQPPPTRSAGDPGQSYGLLILHRHHLARRVPAVSCVFNPTGDLVQAISDLVQPRI